MYNFWLYAAIDRICLTISVVYVNLILQLQSSRNHLAHEMFDRKYSWLAHLDMSLASCEPNVGGSGVHSVSVTQEKCSYYLIASRRVSPFKTGEQMVSHSAASSVMQPPLLSTFSRASCHLLGSVPPSGADVSLQRAAPVGPGHSVYPL